MTTPFFPVSPTQIPLHGDPAGNANTFANELAAMGGSYNALNANFAGGADPTDTYPCDTAVQAAINALPASGGSIDFPPGTYKFTSGVTISQAGVYLRAVIPGTVIFDYHGTGDCVRMYATQQYTAGFGGGMLGGIIIDGTNSGGTGASGLHAGDIYKLVLDVGVRKFRADPTAKGIWFDNQYWYAEEMAARVWAEQNSNCVVFDNSANLNGTYSPTYFATGSFKGARLDLTLDCKGSGNGLVVQGGATPYDSDFTIVGNMDYAGSVGQGPFAAIVFNDTPLINFTATNASPCVFTAAGSHYYNGQTVNLVGASLPGGFAAATTYYVVNTNPPAGTFQLAATSGGAALASSSTGSGQVKGFPCSQIYRSSLKVGVELNAINANAQPYTINFGNPSVQTAGIFQCAGWMDFASNNPFALNTTGFGGNFQFDGPVFGDSRLFRTTGLGRTNYELGSVANGTTIFTRYTSVAKGSTASAATVTGLKLQTGSVAGETQTQDFTLINLGPGAMQFAASGSNVRDGANCIIQPDTAAHFLWEPDSSAWIHVQGSAPVPQVSYTAPATATGQTFDRNLATVYLSGLTSQTVYCSAIELPANVPVSNITLDVGGIAFTGVTHGWYALLDSGMVVRAVSADQSGAWGSTFALTTLSVAGASYVTTYPGLYYVAFCATFTGSGEFPALGNPVGGLLTVAPQLGGTSSTGQTTPPATGTTLAALSGTLPSNARFYAYTS